MKTHVVVTYYRSPKGGLVQHAYGPFTPQKAWRERKAILESPEYAEDVKAGRLAVSACKMLDISATGEELRTY